ncbi:MAG: ABC transporter permease [Candidatus Gracilibacteria bacterium]|jgi:ABC-2 type transport system permease protein
MNLKGQWIAFTTIVRKEVTRFMRIWVQTLLPPVINQILYFIIFGAFIGAQIRELNGIPYASFIVPGLIMMAVISNSFSNVVSSFFGTKFMHSVEELMVSPTKNAVILLGYSVGGMLRGILIGLIVFLVSSFFTPISLDHPFVAILFAVLCSALFSFAGFLNALFAKKFDDVSVFPTFVLTPLTYLGGVFYSIDALPPFWQTISKFNPIVYIVDGFRYGFFGFSEMNVWASLAVLCVFTLALFFLNLHLLNRGTGLKS